jgi:hypothetical protein
MLPTGVIKLYATTATKLRGHQTRFERVSPTNQVMNHAANHHPAAGP